MVKQFLKDFPALIFCAVVAVALAYACVSDIDKDVENECGYTAVSGKPKLCLDWWADKGVDIPESVQKTYSESPDEDAE